MPRKTIKIGPTEIRLNNDGTIDEIVVMSEHKCLFHLEQMDKGHFWAAAYDPDADRDLHMDFVSARPIRAKTRTYEPQDWTNYKDPE